MKYSWLALLLATSVSAGELRRGNPPIGNVVSSGTPNIIAVYTSTGSVGNQTDFRLLAGSTISAQGTLAISTASQPSLMTKPNISLDLSGNVILNGSTVTPSGDFVHLINSSITLSGPRGNLVTGSSVTAGTFYGDGSQLTGISAGETNTFQSSKTFIGSLLISTTQAQPFRIGPSSVTIDSNGNAVFIGSVSVLGIGSGLVATYNVSAGSISLTGSGACVAGQGIGWSADSGTNICRPNSDLLSFRINGSRRLTFSGTDLDLNDNPTTRLLLANGTAASPAITWSASTGNGIYHTGNNDRSINFVCGSSLECLKVANTGVTISSNTLRLDGDTALFSVGGSTFSVSQGTVSIGGAGGGDFEVTAATVNIKGNASGSGALAGYVGEIISGTLGSSVSLPPSATYFSISTITLTAGEWDVTGTCGESIGATTAQTVVQCSISNSTTTFETTRGDAFTTFGASPSASVSVYLPVGPRQIIVGVSTTYYLVARTIYTTLGGAQYTNDSIIRARRMR